MTDPEFHDAVVIHTLASVASVAANCTKASSQFVPALTALAFTYADEALKERQRRAGPEPVKEAETPYTNTTAQVPGKKTPTWKPHTNGRA